MIQNLRQQSDRRLKTNNMKSFFVPILFLAVAVHSAYRNRVISATILVDIGLQAQLKNTTEFVNAFFGSVNVLLYPLGVGVKITGIHKENEKSRLITVRDKNNVSIGLSMVRTNKILNQEFKEVDFEKNVWDLGRGQDFVTSEMINLYHHMKTSESDVVIALTLLGVCDENFVAVCSKSKKGVAGMAFRGGACTVTKNLAIVTVPGKYSLFVAAHEIGHLLGIHHDDSSINIMHPSSSIIEDLTFHQRHQRCHDQRSRRIKI